MKYSKKMTGRVAVALLMCLLFLAPCFSVKTYAAAGRMVLGLSANSVAVGDEITVYITAKDAQNGSVNANMKITYNTAVFEYVSCNAAGASNSDGAVTVSGSSISITFKAIAAGECRVIANGTSDAGELTAGGVRIPATGEGQAEEPEEQNTEEPEQQEEQSADNTTTEEPKEEPKDEDNTTTEKNGEITFEIEGVTYLVSSDFDNELVNKGFEPVDIIIDDTTVKGLQYPETDWTVLFLMEKGNDANNGYYLYNAQSGVLCPYLSYKTTIITPQEKEGNVSDAEYSRLKERYDALKRGNKKMMFGMIIGVAVLLLIILNVLIFRRINRSVEGEYDEFDDESEVEAIEKQGAYLKAKASKEQAKELEEEIKDIVEQEKERSVKNDSVKNTVTTKEEDADDSLEIIDFEDL